MSLEFLCLHIGAFLSKFFLNWAFFQPALDFFTHNTAHTRKLLPNDASNLSTKFCQIENNTCVVGSLVALQQNVYYYTNGSNIGRTEKTELLQALPAITAWLDAFDGKSNRTLVNEINYHSTIHPGYIQFFLKQLDNELADIVKTYQPTSDFNYNHAAAKLLRSHLLKCDQVSFIESYGECLDLLREMDQRNLANAYIGEEKLFETSTTMRLEGIWPMFIIKRLRAFQNEAGISDWLTDLAEAAKFVESQNIKRIQELETPSMRGNIIVIFSVLGAGCAIGFLCFTFETSKLIFVCFQILFGPVRKIIIFNSLKIFEKLSCLTIVEYF